MSKKEMRRLPNGKLTQSTIKFVKEWKKFNRALESQLPGVVVYAFDPGVLVRDAISGNGSISFPHWFAIRLAEKAGWKP